MAAPVRVRVHYAAGSVRQGIARALNRAIMSVRTQVTRAVASNVGIKQALVRDRIRIQEARPERLEARLELRGRRLPLTAFGARQTRRGVTYRLKGGKGLVPGGFLATMASGHRGVFVRKAPTRSRAGLRRGAPALPIREAFGPSLPFVAIQGGILETGRAHGSAAFLKAYAHEVRQMGRRSA